MEESFRLSDCVSRLLEPEDRASTKAMLASTPSTRQKTAPTIRARFLIHGPDYYVLAAHSRGKDRSFTGFFNSFAFTPYRYPSFRNYADTFMHISVTTPDGARCRRRHAPDLERAAAKNS